MVEGTFIEIILQHQMGVDSDSSDEEVVIA